MFEQVRETGPDVGSVMNEVMQDPDLRERGNEVNQLVQDLTEQLRGRDEETLERMASLNERAVYEEAREYLVREFDAEIVVESEEEADSEQAKDALPFRPAVHLS